jgi:hypothetical protein
MAAVIWIGRSSGVNILGNPLDGTPIERIVLAAEGHKWRSSAKPQAKELNHGFQDKKSFQRKDAKSRRRKIGRAGTTNQQMPFLLGMILKKISSHMRAAPVGRMADLFVQKVEPTY